MKYSPSLCHRCNTTLSQPFDRAYDAFIAWLFNNEDLVLRRRFLSFSEAFGHDWELAQLNLYKYFTKSFGCRVVDAGARVPPDVVELFGNDRFLTKLRLTFAVNEDVLIMPPFDRAGFIGKGELVALPTGTLLTFNLLQRSAGPSGPVRTDRGYHSAAHPGSASTATPS